MQNIVLVLITAIGFGVWPLLARYAGLSSIATALLIALGTLFPVMIGARFMPFNYGQTSGRAIVIGLLGGVINGVAFLAYSRVVSNPELNLSVYIPAMVLISVFVTVVGSAFFFGETISINKVAGFILMSAAIYFFFK